MRSACQICVDVCALQRNTRCTMDCWRGLLEPGTRHSFSSESRAERLGPSRSSRFPLLVALNL